VYITNWCVLYHEKTFGLVVNVCIVAQGYQGLIPSSIKMVKLYLFFLLI